MHPMIAIMTTATKIKIVKKPTVPPTAIAIIVTKIRKKSFSLIMSEYSIKEINSCHYECNMCSHADNDDCYLYYQYLILVERVMGVVEFPSDWSWFG